MLSHLRKAVGPLKRRAAEPIARSGISPNLFTVLGIPLSVTAAWLFIHENPMLAFPLAVAAALIDFLDGEVARLQDKVTPFGNMFEAVVDRFVDSALLVALATRYPLAAACALGASFLVSYVKARTGLVIITDNHDWPGMGDRSDRVAFILMAWLLHALTLYTLAVTILWLLTLVSLTGTVQRLLHARSLIRDAESNDALLPYLKD
jgi:phosphatidylglycerophosphate synthase